MKTQTAFLLFICMLTLPSCNDGHTGHRTGKADTPYLIDLEGGISNIASVQLSTIGKKLEYIPLETDTACLLSRISNVSLCDSLIFVNDGTRLLCFDRTGSFLYRIGSVGRGPEEYTYVRSFYTDRDNRELYLLSMGKVLVFGFDGKFRRTFKADFRPSQVICSDRNTLMFHLFNMSGPLPDTAFSWYLTDKQGNIMMKYLNHHKRMSRPGLIVPDSPLYLYNGIAHFLEFGNDTLYYLNKSEMAPYAVISPGKLKMEPDLLITPETSKEVFARIKENFWISDIKENDDCLFIKLSWGLSDSVSGCIFDKSRSTVTVLKENGFKDDINGGPAFWPKYISDNDILVDHIDAFTLLNKIKNRQSGDSNETGAKTGSGLEELAGKINENSNPVLIVLK